MHNEHNKHFIIMLLSSLATLVLGTRKSTFFPIQCPVFVKAHKMMQFMQFDFLMKGLSLFGTPSTKGSGSARV